MMNFSNMHDKASNMILDIYSTYLANVRFWLGYYKREWGWFSLNLRMYMYYLRKEYERMELLATIDIEKLPAGVYMVTSEQIPGLVVETNTLKEIYEIIPDIAQDLCEDKKYRKIILTYNLKD